LHTTTLTFPYPTKEHARSVAAALEREAGDIEGGRTVAAVEREERTVAVRIEAADLTALRAGANTWCGLVEVAERAAELGA
jgi:KEOPS complex subunit Pcc1